MSTLPLCLLPDPVLREKSEPVTEITPDLLKFIDDMLETMYHEEGDGLAAPGGCSETRDCDGCLAP